MTARAEAAKDPELQESADRALKYLHDQLLNGFSGKFLIDAHRGGIRHFREERILQSVDLDAELGKTKP